MATATTAPLRPGVVLPGIGWEGYLTLLDLIGDGHTRVTYDRGDAEVMSPSPAHEQFSTLFCFLVMALAVASETPLLAYGSTTWRKRAADRGIEADECFYVGENANLLSDVKIDVETSPPPDLAIEIEVTRTVIERLPVYAGLGVPEIWRFDEESLTVLLLDETGHYVESARSRAFPWLEVSEAAGMIRAGLGKNLVAWQRELNLWANELHARRQVN